MLSKQANQIIMVVVVVVMMWWDDDDTPYITATILKALPLLTQLLLIQTLRD